MSSLPSPVNLRSLASSARTLLDTTCSVAEVHIHDLKSQLDDLWNAAEGLFPTTVAAELIAHVERTVEELGNWRAIGLRAGVST